jgi:hypothetical protein
MNRGQLVNVILLVVVLAGQTWSGGIVVAQADEPGQSPIVATVVGGEGVNIRACPRPDCAVIAVALLNETILVTGEAVDGFLPVDWGGAVGWAYGLYIATPDRGAPELRQGMAGCNRVALIFNIGVGYEPHLELLDDLKAQNIAVTVFPMGWWAAEHAAAMKSIADTGFPIGSHGHQRLKLTERGDAEIKQDISAAAATIEQVIGRKPDPYFTMPRQQTSGSGA